MVVVGRASDRWGQEVVALVSLQEGVKVTEEDILEECGRHIARYKFPKAILFLLGTQMDYQTTKMSSGFVFNNPNQTSACGCGESFSV